jgi:plasmid stabilization system protein ParE
MSSYRYSSDANCDIEKILLYILELNPVAADHFLETIFPPAYRRHKSGTP